MKVFYIYKRKKNANIHFLLRAEQMTVDIYLCIGNRVKDNQLATGNTQATYPPSLSASSELLLVAGR